MAGKSGTGSDRTDRSLHPWVMLRHGEDESLGQGLCPGSTQPHPSPWMASTLLAAKPTRAPRPARRETAARSSPSCCPTCCCRLWRARSGVRGSFVTCLLPLQQGILGDRAAPVVPCPCLTSSQLPPGPARRLQPLLPGAAGAALSPCCGTGQPGASVGESGVQIQCCLPTSVPGLVQDGTSQKGGHCPPLVPRASCTPGQLGMVPPEEKSSSCSGPDLALHSLHVGLSCLLLQTVQEQRDLLVPSRHLTLQLQHLPKHRTNRTQVSWLPLPSSFLPSPPNLGDPRCPGSQPPCSDPSHPTPIRTQELPCTGADLRFILPNLLC